MLWVCVMSKGEGGASACRTINRAKGEAHLCVPEGLAGSDVRLTRHNHALEFGTYLNVSGTASSVQLWLSWPWPMLTR